MNSEKSKTQIHPEFAETIARNIVLKGVRTHNLKNIDVEIPKAQMTTITGVSGSGKSSLAFDTLFAEGQRRYTESLSTYVRQFIEQMRKPPVTVVENIQPALALKQKNDISNVRSTVGTVTEINELLQLIFARAGKTFCPNGHGEIRRDTVMSTVDTLRSECLGERVYLTATVRAPEEQHRGTVLRQLLQDGYRRLFVDGKLLEIDEKETRDVLLDLEAFPVLIDRFKVSGEDQQRIAEAIETGFAVGKGEISIIFADREGRPQMNFSQAFRCNVCDLDFVEPRPDLFSFNHSLGACPACDGRGRASGIDYKLVIPNRTLSILDGAVKPFQLPSQRSWQKKLINAMKSEGYAIDIPYRRLPTDAQKFILNGKHGTSWKGLRGYFQYHQGRQKRFSRILVARFRGYDDCDVCQGSRLAAPARNVVFKEKLISDFWDETIENVYQWFQNLELSEFEERAIGIVVEEIRNRLSYLCQIGVGYLTLGRPSKTLSGGETQRVHLTTSLGRALTDTLYVLDEPTAGLHMRDSQRLLDILHNLRDLGNTVVIVEHDTEVIEGSDHIVEIGPGAGHLGGTVVFDGPKEEFLDADTVTARALSSHLTVPQRTAKVASDYIRVRGARTNNLENIDVDFPIGQLTAVTGVSGSGKSSLLYDTVYRHYLHETGTAVEPAEVDEITGFEKFAKLEMMDQSAIGRSTRSNAMTYTNSYDEIRKIFAKTRDAKKRGISARDFSINVKGGRCEDCDGLGIQSIDMHFLADIEIECETCRGKRFQSRILGVYHKGKNIDDVFEMTVDEGVEFFATERKIVERLRPLQDVGLGYLRLGQPTTTLSGGEAQRLKLATYMMSDTSSVTKERVLFIFDEPTVGLHMEDVKVLCRAMRGLVQRGHTVIVVEHNLDFVAQCDYVIDIGPDAGFRGGRVVAAGTPREVADAGGLTARFLAPYFAAGE